MKRISISFLIISAMLLASCTGNEAESESGKVIDTSTTAEESAEANEADTPDTADKSSADETESSRTEDTQDTVIPVGDKEVSLGSLTLSGCRILDKDGVSLLNIGYYSDTPTITKATLHADGVSFTLTGTDKNGEALTVSLAKADGEAESFYLKADPSGDVLRASYFVTADIDGELYTFKTDTAVIESNIRKIGKYTSIKYEPVLIEGNKVVLELAPGYDFQIINDYICAVNPAHGEYDMSIEMIYSADLTLLYEGSITEISPKKFDGTQYAKTYDGQLVILSGDSAEVADPLGRFHITKKSVYNSDGNKLLDFEDYADGFVITEKSASENGVEFTLNGHDINGEPVTVKYELADPDEDAMYCYTVDTSGDTLRAEVRYFDYQNHNKMWKVIDAPVRESETEMIGDMVHIIDHAVLIKDGEVKYFNVNDKVYHIVQMGDYIAAYYGPSLFPDVYNMNLEHIYDGELYYFSQLSDGRYIAFTSLDEDSRALIFDGNGNIVYESEDDRTCLHAGPDYMLMRDADGVVRLYTPGGKLLCEYADWSRDYIFHHMLSGVLTPDGVMGCYFAIEDPTKTDENNYPRNAEYYYIPDTGESGIIEYGYSPFAYAKPVLYLYPTEETDVTVTFDNPDRLTTVYPAYNGAWNVTAKPDGTLTDESGRTYYALYWEEDSGTPIYRFTDGFCVRGEDSAEFLEDVLDSMGFTEREANEFIIYWLPIMEQNEYSLIRFELTEDRDAASGLNIYPKPDSVLRMAMHIKAADSLVDIPEQKLPAFERRGFVAVEWGGSVH